VIPAAALAVVVMLGWAYLLFDRARLSGTSEFDRIDTKEAPERWPAVSIIIPARDEAEMIPFTLPSALSFYYPYTEVILVDDCSRDRTIELATNAAKSQGRESLKVVRGTMLPARWSGKLWALEQGVEASTGEWLLFLDADIFANPNLLRDLMRLALNERYQMVSLMVLLRAEGFWDRLLIPSFFFFFHLLYPFHRVRQRGSAVAAAAGGCVLVNREALAAAGGLDSVRDAWIDDVALAGALKRSGASIYLGATVQAASFRKYGTLRSIRQMVTRSAFTQLRYSWILLVLTLLSLGILFGVPVVGALWVSTHAGTETAVWYLLSAASCLSIAFMLAAYAPALRLYQLPIFWGLTLPAAAAVYGAMTVESALAHKFGKGPHWKGRTP
jgi:hopene-associated glycosyltransferase HpnB